MTIFQEFKHKNVRVVIRESSSDKGYQFKCLVNGMSLGCCETEDLARLEAISFIDKAEEAQQGVTQ